MLNLMVLQCLTVFLKKPILALQMTYYEFVQVFEIIGGGGGNDMFATPIFSLGATGLQDRRLW